MGTPSETDNWEGSIGWAFVEKHIVVNHVAPATTQPLSSKSSENT